MSVTHLFSTFSHFLSHYAHAGFIGEGITTDDVIGGAIILFACLSNEFNFYDKFMSRNSESISTP